MMNQVIDELLELVRENNSMLTKILSIMQEISSEEHIKNKDMKAFATNLLADIIVQYKSEQIEQLAKQIKL